MTKKVVKIYPQNTIKDAIEIFIKYPYSVLPVVDEEEKVIGVLSRTDIMNAIVPDFLEEIENVHFIKHFGRIEEEFLDLSSFSSLLLVKDLMNEHPICIDADHSLLKAAVLMQKKKVTTLPVIENGRLCGIITRTDIIVALYKKGGER